MRALSQFLVVSVLNDTAIKYGKEKDYRVMYQLALDDLHRGVEIVKGKEGPTGDRKVLDEELYNVLSKRVKEIGPEPTFESAKARIAGILTRNFGEMRPFGDLLVHNYREALDKVASPQVKKQVDEYCKNLTLIKH